ncbi:hypothetical protein AAIR29_09145 [Psychrobacter sp. FBL11]|uniref:Uncharacterized protein n=1 Tax=Psychrobacter saeujeotis TaxID=3143436 RepID=A0ABU9X8T6_9GAMM|nr:hypothetical protein [uncultured Psychrobacter sp.]
MTSKKSSPTLSKISTTGVRSNKLLIIVLLLLAVVIAYFVWSRPLSNTSTPVKETATKTVSSQAETLSDNADSDLADPVDTMNNNVPLSSEKAEPIETQVSDSETILNASLPETDSLAKEEVDRLEDEHQRLIEQEKLAAEQVQMNKKLTDMKAEQIKLLEQQIAQLEAAQTVE